MKIKRLMSSRRLSEFDIAAFSDPELGELGERISRVSIDDLVIWLRWGIRQLRAITKPLDDLNRVRAQIEQLRLDVERLRALTTEKLSKLDGKEKVIE